MPCQTSAQISAIPTCVGVNRQRPLDIDGVDAIPTCVGVNRTIEQH